jgi:hypothetical protein
LARLLAGGGEIEINKGLAKTGNLIQQRKIRPRQYCQVFHGERLSIWSSPERGGNRSGW